MMKIICKIICKFFYTKEIDTALAKLGRYCYNVVIRSNAERCRIKLRLTRIANKIFARGKRRKTILFQTL